MIWGACAASYAIRGVQGGMNDMHWMSQKHTKAMAYSCTPSHPSARYLPGFWTVETSPAYRYLDWHGTLQMSWLYRLCVRGWHGLRILQHGRCHLSSPKIPSELRAFPSFQCRDIKWWSTDAVSRCFMPLDSLRSLVLGVRFAHRLWLCASLCSPDLRGFWTHCPFWILLGLFDTCRHLLSSPVILVAFCIFLLWLGRDYSCWVALCRVLSCHHSHSDWPVRF